ncbi:hypothetical protein [Phormidesmis sp. 146-33]
MEKAFLSAGFRLCNLLWSILESIEDRHLAFVTPFTSPSHDAIPTPLQDLLPKTLIPQSNEFEALRVLVIGSVEGVNETVQNLHARHFAQASDWSPLLPAPIPGTVMRVLVRQRQK